MAIKPNKSDNTALNPAAILVAVLSVALVMIVFALPTFLLVLFGLAPTWVAFATDRSYAKARGFAVGTFNLSGAAPFFVRVWRGPDSMATSLDVLSDPYSWLVMYGAAAVSLALVWVAPSISGALLEIRAAAKAARLERKQHEIIDNWGEEIRDHAQATMIEHGYLGAEETLSKD